VIERVQPPAKEHVIDSSIAVTVGEFSKVAEDVAHCSISVESSLNHRYPLTPIVPLVRGMPFVKVATACKSEVNVTLSVITPE
jgi:hypothetical protein